MALYTMEVAQQHLASWIAAELALSTGQAYNIAGRSLTRVDLADVMKQITYWQKQVADIELEQSGLRRRSKIRRYVPMDL